MAEYKEAKAEKRSYHKMHMMSISKGANGGHKVVHHLQKAGEMVMPKEHNFGPEDAASGATHAHIMGHLKSMGIQEGGEQTAEAMPETQEAET